MKALESFYNESNVKKQSRSNILIAALQMAHNYGIEGFTLQSVASQAGITIRNLYRYYENKDFLVIDITYYLLTHFDRNKEFTYEIPVGFSGLDALRAALSQAYLEGRIVYRDSSLLLDNLSTLRILSEFDFYLLKMSTDNPAYIRYITLYMKEGNSEFDDYLKSILLLGASDGSMNISAKDVPLYLEFITQSMIGLGNRIILKEHERTTINMSLMWKNLDMIIAYLKNPCYF